MRVLYLSWRDQENPEAGGSETFAERTSEVLAELGNEVTLFTSAFPGAQPETTHGHVRVVRRGGRFTCYLRGLAHVARHGSDYDVIIDVQNGVPFWSPLTSRVPVVNLVHHVHRDQWGVIFGPRVARFGWFLESKVAPRVYRKSRYVTVSQATRTDLDDLGIAPHRVDLVYNGNDLPTSPPNVPLTTHPSIVVLGRLVPHKQVEIAIDILAALGEQHPDLRLDIVGTGYWHDDLVEHAARCGVTDRVQFHGFVEESTKHEILARSWLMLLPSHKEGWGLTIVEAGLHGTPALAFAHAGGPSESIMDGLTGVLCNDVPDMQQQVNALLADHGTRQGLGEAARQHARSFDWHDSGLRLEATLRSVLNLPHRAVPETPSDVVPAAEVDLEDLEQDLEPLPR
ncbi:glycosyltransferase family 4 protein [Leekyejoonella antrihumi]|uniref:Glycosyltransferase family 4 protein n=1 Tax=Leekyejoonella antrihumi TaxID=1660198 RepID=A0A563E5Y0_9MICO|nr:glycosyltransferase family 4 protein [Leekyejoonella antrihumi]